MTKYAYDTDRKIYRIFIESLLENYLIQEIARLEKMGIEGAVGITL